MRNNIVNPKYPGNYPIQTIKHDSSPHLTLMRFMIELFKRLPSEQRSEFQRILYSTNLRAGSSEPLIDPFVYMSPHLSEEQWSAVVSGALANMARLMSDKSKRLNPDIIKIAPPLGSPTSGLTLTTGDLDVVRAASDDRQINDAITTLSDNRARISHAINNLHIPTLEILSSILNTALSMSNDGSDFMVNLIAVVSRYTGKDPLPLRSTQKYSTLRKRNDSDRDDVGQGGLAAATVATLISRGRMILSVIGFIHSAYLLIKKTNPDVTSKVSGLNLNNVSATIKDLENTVRTYGTQAQFAAFTTSLTDFNKTINADRGPTMSSSQFDQWFQIILPANAKYWIDKTSRYLQGSFANLYKQMNPKADKSYKFLTPPTTLPTEFLLSFLTSPEIMKDQKLVDEDFSNYAAGVKQYEPSSHINWSVEKMRILNGFNPEEGPLELLKSSDGWDKIVDRYIREILVPYIPKLISIFKAIILDSIQWALTFAKYYPQASPNRVFGSSKPVITPWDKKQMDDLKTRIEAIHIQFTKNNVSTGESNKNTSGDNTIVINNTDDNNDQNDVIVVPDNSNSGNDNSRRNTSADGTIIITPHETIINMGHYQDPQTGAINDFEDLYIIGKAIKDARMKARFMINLPYQGFASGDIATGSILGIAAGIAGKLAKKALQSPAISNILKKKRGAGENLVKKLVTDDPSSIKNLAEQVTNRETKSIQTLDNALANGLPLSPQGLMELLSAVQTLAPIIKDMSEDIKNLVKMTNLISAKILTSESLAANAQESIQPFDRGFNVATPVMGLIDSLALADDPSDRLASLLVSQGDLSTYTLGDIDLWRVVI